MEASESQSHSVAGPSSAPVEEPKRKRSSQEGTSSSTTAAEAASPSSRLPPDKHRQEPNMSSVVIAVTPRTDQRGSSSAQVSMNEPMQTYESDAGNIFSSVPSGTPSSSAAPVERPAEQLRPAYLPPSEDVSVWLSSNARLETHLGRC